MVKHQIMILEIVGSNPAPARLGVCVLKEKIRTATIWDVLKSYLWHDLGIAG